MEIVNLPEGWIAPKIASAKAVPPRMPGLKHSKTACALTGRLGQDQRLAVYQHGNDRLAEGR